ncbi:MAG: hypothetical protein JNM72_23910 [Deltaproteobacteria bacterium]|nr:hypothetical protein [Deltaproteobacteria bacterium]
MSAGRAGAWVGCLLALLVIGAQGPSAVGAPAPAGPGALVVVAAGEDLAAVAGRAGVMPAALAAENGLQVDAPLAAGTLLRLPLRAGEVPGPGLVLALVGQATVRVGAAPPIPVSEGGAVPLGALLCTAAESYLTVRMAWDAAGGGHDDVNLLPGTCATLAAAHVQRGQRISVLRLQQGSVTVPAQRPGERGGAVTVETAAGASAAEAGGFRVHVEPEAARTEALGTPMVVYGAGVAQPLAAGEGSRTRAGEAPGRPVPLLVPGQLLRPAAGAELRRPELVWAPVERALSYQVELATSADFRSLALVVHRDEARFAPTVLALPYRVPGLWWRVSPVDRTGFIGLPSDGRPLRPPAGVGP